jgi:plasmid stabilization system protein ParE
VKVRFTASAEADLEAIVDWIAEDDPGRAASFVVELRGRCLSLADEPNRFPVARRVVPAALAARSAHFPQGCHRHVRPEEAVELQEHRQPILQLQEIGRAVLALDMLDPEGGIDLGGARIGLAVESAVEESGVGGAAPGRHRRIGPFGGFRRHCRSDRGTGG